MFSCNMLLSLDFNLLNTQVVHGCFERDGAGTPASQVAAIDKSEVFPGF